MESISLTSTGAESLEALKQEFLRNELARNNETHGAYLRAIQHLFRGWMPEGSAVAIPDSQPVAARPSSRKSIWEQADLLELCGGGVSRILGSDYSAIDALPLTCLPPMPPFMFISRVTRMTAQADRLGTCDIAQEDDFPHDAVYAYPQAVPRINSFD